ncbi:shikimate kinase AroK [Aurantivibrio plasticivorans]
MARKVVLVGPMGSGKSTVGKVVANLLSLPFLDMDQIIEERTGADISWIFDVEGESGFRDREQQLLSELLDAHESCVIATGGGVVERDANRSLLSGRGDVVYLNASLSQLAQRTAKDKKRPLLQVNHPKQRIKELYQRRDPLYREVADHIIDTNAGNPKAVAQSIVSSLNY